MRSLQAKLLLFLLLLTLPGCLMAREGDLKLPAQWPPQSNLAGKKSISLNVTGVFNPESSNQGASQQALEMYRAQALKAYVESGIFSEVNATGASSDIQADISIVEEGSQGLAFLSGFISGYTMGLIPGYASIDLTAKTAYKDRAGTVLASLSKKEELGFWIQIFLLFAMPFVDGPDTVTKAAHYDLHRITIDEAHAKGAF